MARKVVTTTEFTDDISGGKAEGTVTFSFDGTSYEIDLSKANARAFEKAILPYVGAARKVRGTRGPGRKPAGSKLDLNAIRTWAKSNGYEVADRGRVAATIIDAYQAAN